MTAQNRLLGRIRELALAVRHGLNALEMDGYVLSNRDCGHTALLLAMYLEDNGCGAFQYVNRARIGPDGHPEFHTWLEQDGLIVDICGHEFSDCPEEVVVSQHSPWHAVFDPESGEPEDYKPISEGWPELHEAYEYLRRRLNQA